MQSWICHTARLGVFALACGCAAAIADTGSEKLDAQLALLQQQIGLRQQLADALRHDELALGYSVPEITLNQNVSMVAKADDDAFTLAMVHLHKTMSMFAMLE